jgi:UDP-N-acetylmuramoyl-tripeptide--D-alanyl-D-alanine ligase
VVRTEANQNNEIGVPLTLLQLEPESQAVIVEMGMRGRGQIAALAAVAEPDVGIITNIHPVHLELLGSLENIADAKAELLEGLRPGGVGVVPLGSEPLEPCLTRATCRVVRFAVDGETTSPARVPDVTGSLEPHGDREGQVVRVRWPGGEARVDVAGMPRHTLQNLTAAAAGCYAAGLPLETCLAGFLDSGPGKGRGEELDLPGIRIIDDTYNANPAAVRAAIDHLVTVSERLGGRPVMVLGDMKELGPEERIYHRQTGEYAAAAGVEVLWGVGELSEAAVEGYRAACGAGAGGERAGHIDSPAETHPVAESLRAGDVVLFKASRSIGLEAMVEAIAGQARAGRWAEAGGRAGTETSFMRARRTE